MANLNGMLLMEGASVSHMRVYYGGLQLGLSLFLIWAARAPERARPALMMLMITMTALVLGRLVSLWLDGGELVGFDLASLVYRIFAAALAAVAGTSFVSVRSRSPSASSRLRAGASASRRNPSSSAKCRRRSSRPGRAGCATVSSWRSIRVSLRQPPR